MPEITVNEPSNSWLSYKTKAILFFAIGLCYYFGVSMEMVIQFLSDFFKTCKRELGLRSVDASFQSFEPDRSYERRRQQNMDRSMLASIDQSQIRDSRYQSPSNNR